MIKDFKAFIARGNVLDLAVGVVIGAAFGKVVASFVEDILMPPIGLVIGNVDFSNLFVNLSGTSYPSVAEAKKAGAPTLNYGLFLNNVIYFLIIAFAVFLVVRLAMRLLPKPPTPSTTKACPFCVSNIAVAATRCPHCTSELK